MFAPDPPEVPIDDFAIDDRDSAPLVDDDTALMEGGDSVPVFSDMDLQPALELNDIEIEEVMSESRLNLRVLAEDERTMTTEYDKLVRIDAYRPVLWSGWVQDMYEEDVTPGDPTTTLG